MTKKNNMAIYPQDQQNNSHDNDIDNDSLHCVFNFTAMRLQTFSDKPLRKLCLANLNVDIADVWLNQ